MFHTHHILPKYKGGSDSPSNLIKVSVTKHAMFHFCNWQLWGDKRDWLAWRGLTGEIGKEELVYQLRMAGSQKGLLKMHARGATPARIEAARRNQPKATLAAKSPESNQKRKESFERIGHSQGDKNSQYGTMWITNGTINKKIKKTDQILEGYYPGRKLK